MTSNHTQLLVTADSPADLSRFMQELEGEFAQCYNLRKGRSGAFWSERYHATIIEYGDHLWNCMKYIEIHMVRACVVRHPREWRWCGYHELLGSRQRYRILDLERVLASLNVGALEAFARRYEDAIVEAIEGEQMQRQAVWTESIAAGSKLFVEAIAGQTKPRSAIQIRENKEGTWIVCEESEDYRAISAGLGRQYPRMVAHGYSRPA